MPTDDRRQKASAETARAGSNDARSARQFATTALGEGARHAGRTSGDVASAPRVLVVDDDDDARAMYADYLAWRGYRVQKANDGAGAIAVASASPPDAIVIDLAMAVMDGLSTVRWLKSNESTSKTPTIVLTASGPEAYEDAKAAGCDVFLSKPCTPDALENVLEAVLHDKHVR